MKRKSIGRTVFPNLYRELSNISSAIRIYWRKINLFSACYTTKDQSTSARLGNSEGCSEGDVMKILHSMCRGRFVLEW